jgi:hypothetical protein
MPSLTDSDLEYPWHASGDTVMVEECPLLLPYLQLATMTQKAENFSSDPSSEDMSTVERIERDVHVCTF